jgi:hypothetical protein
MKESNPTHCANCGAPRTVLHNGTCAYCGERLVVTNLPPPVASSSSAQPHWDAEGLAWLALRPVEIRSEYRRGVERFARDRGLTVIGVSAAERWFASSQPVWANDAFADLAKVSPSFGARDARKRRIEAYAMSEGILTITSTTVCTYEDAVLQEARSLRQHRKTNLRK